jgi:hypothetical protein
MVYDEKGLGVFIECAYVCVCVCVCVREREKKDSRDKCCFQLCMGVKLGLYIKGGT